MSSQLSAWAVIDFHTTLYVMVYSLLARKPISFFDQRLKLVRKAPHPFVTEQVLLLTNSIVYDLRTQNLNFVAPITEQTGTTTVHFPEVSAGQEAYIVVVISCSGMGATNLNSKGPANFRS